MGRGKSQQPSDWPASRAVARALEQMAAAIAHGEIDALVLPTRGGKRVFTSASSDEPYRILVEAMDEGALTLSPRGAILYANKAFAKIAGTSLEKVIGNDFTRLVAAIDRAKLGQLMKDAHHRAARAELTLLSAEGKAAPVYVCAQPMPGKGSPLVAVVVTDLTELDAARRIQCQYAAILETSADAIFCIDHDGVLLSWNQGAEKLLRYTAAEVIGQPVQLTFAEDRRAELAALLGEVSQGAAVGNVETVQKRKGGDLVDVVLSLSPIRDRDGKVAAANAIARDNTEAKRSRHLLECVLEAAHDAIIVARPDGRVMLVNSQAETLFGRRREELIGKSSGLLFPLSQFTLADEAEWGTESSGHWMETRGTRADGSQFPAEINVGVITVGDDLLSCATVRDLSERYAIEQQLQANNIRLREALQAKDRFLAHMSHELRTPLTAIIGFTGILLMNLAGPLTAAQTRQLELIRSSGRVLLELISDLLDLARVESGNAKLRLEAVDCGRVLEGALQELAGTAEQKQILLTMNHAGPVMAHTDPRLLRQILVNLVSNAVKFTDKGSVRLSCAYHVEEGRRWVCFQVADTGIGMLPEDIPRLFTEFARLPNGPAHGKEGTGLGLYLSQKIAMLLGGKITVESKPGVGSTFVLTLPETADLAQVPDDAQRGPAIR